MQSTSQANGIDFIKN